MARLARVDHGGSMPAMAETSTIEQASRRLTLALDTLEAAIDRRREAEREDAGLIAQVHALGADRSRLACDLDAAIARSRSLETANREIARRLDVAIGSIRSVLDTNDH
jgi:hypothetical protein